MRFGHAPLVIAVTRSRLSFGCANCGAADQPRRPLTCSPPLLFSGLLLPEQLADCKHLHGIQLDADIFASEFSQIYEPLFEFTGATIATISELALRSCTPSQTLRIDFTHGPRKDWATGPSVSPPL